MEIIEEYYWNQRNQPEGKEEIEEENGLDLEVNGDEGMRHP